MHPAPNHLKQLSTGELRDYRHELRETLAEMRAANPDRYWGWIVERITAIDTILTAREELSGLEHHADGHYEETHEGMTFIPAPITDTSGESIYDWGTRDGYGPYRDERR